MSSVHNSKATAASSDGSAAQIENVGVDFSSNNIAAAKDKDIPSSQNADT
jgi:hypothetical protein